jgi:hypothetical protein
VAFFTFRLPYVFTVHIRVFDVPFAHVKNAAFATISFTKLTNAEQHYLQISYTDFAPVRKIKCGQQEPKIIYLLPSTTVNVPTFAKTHCRSTAAVKQTHTANFLKTRETVPLLISRQK